MTKARHVTPCPMNESNDLVVNQIICLELMLIMFNLYIHCPEIFMFFLLIFCCEFLWLIFVTISNFEIFLEFLLKFIWGLMYFYCLLIFIENLFESTELISHNSFHIWFLDKSILSYLQLGCFTPYRQILYYILLHVKFDSAMIESNQLSGSASINLKGHSPFLFCF